MAIIKFKRLGLFITDNFFDFCISEDIDAFILHHFLDVVCKTFVKRLPETCVSHFHQSHFFACHAYLLGKFNSYESAADNSDIFYRFQFLQDSVEIILILIDRKYVFKLVSLNERRDDRKRAGRNY